MLVARKLNKKKQKKQRRHRSVSNDSVEAGKKEVESRGLIIECKVTKEIIRCSMTTSFISTRLPIADWVG